MDVPCRYYVGTPPLQSQISLGLVLPRGMGVSYISLKDSGGRRSVAVETSWASSSWTTSNVESVSKPPTYSLHHLHRRSVRSTYTPPSFQSPVVSSVADHSVPSLGVHFGSLGTEDADPPLFFGTGTLRRPLSGMLPRDFLSLSVLQRYRAPGRP